MTRKQQLPTWILLTTEDGKSWAETPFPYGEKTAKAAARNAVESRGGLTATASVQKLIPGTDHYSPKFTYHRKDSRK